MKLFEKYLNKYVVVWFCDSANEVRKAKGVLTNVTEDFVELVDKEYGQIVIKVSNIIKLSNPKVVFDKTKGGSSWKTQG